MKRMIAEIAKKSHLSQSEVALVFRAFRKKLLERVKNEEPFIYHKLGRLKYKFKRGCTKYIPTKGGYADIPPKILVSFEFVPEYRSLAYEEDTEKDS